MTEELEKPDKSSGPPLYFTQPQAPAQGHQVWEGQSQNQCALPRAGTLSPRLRSQVRGHRDWDFSYGEKGKAGLQAVAKCGHALWHVGKNTPIVTSSWEDNNLHGSPPNH